MSQGKGSAFSLKLVAINLAAGGSAGLSKLTLVVVIEGSGPELVPLGVMCWKCWISESDL